MNGLNSPTDVYGGDRMSHITCTDRKDNGQNRIHELMPSMHCLFVSSVCSVLGMLYILHSDRQDRHCAIWLKRVHETCVFLLMRCSFPIRL